MNCSPQSLASASVCFTECVSLGNAGAVKSFLLCQIASVGLKPSTFAAPTGFNFVPGSTGLTAIAAWNPAPAMATATELWTSSDNITYVLNSSNPVPASGAIVNAPAVGSFTFAKARYVSATVQGAFCAPLEVSGRVCDWAKRVVANGGSQTTLTERTAMNTLDLSLVSNSLDSQMTYVLTYVSSSLIGAITPLYKVVGADPAINTGFVAGDLTINGLQNSGGNSLDIGATVAQLFASATSSGISLYAFTGGSEAGTLYDTGAFDGVSNQATLRVNNGGNCVGCMFASGNQLTVASPGAGFYSTNRVSAVDYRIFWGNSTNAFAQQGATLAGANGATFATDPSIPGLRQGGSTTLWSNHRYSAALWHNGLTLAQATNLFNAVQALRVALGGGSV